MKEIAERGQEAAGAAYEFYFSESETPPEKIQTLIGFPLRNL